MQASLTMLTAKQIGDRIYNYRLYREWTQEKLAEEAEMALDSINKFELGQRKGSLKSYEKIAIALNVPLALLLSPYTKSDLTETQKIIDDSRNPALMGMLQTGLQYIVYENKKDIAFEAKIREFGWKILQGFYPEANLKSKEELKLTAEIDETTIDVFKGLTQVKIKAIE